MAKRPLQKIDLVPDWLRQTIVEAAETAQPMPTAAPREHGFKVVDPFAPEQKGNAPMVRRIKAEFYEDPDNGTAVVQLGWEGTTPPVLEFYKKFASAKDAEVVFSSMLKELRQIESYVDANPAKAKEKVTELFDEYKGQSDIMNSNPEGVGSRTNSSLYLELTPGWSILNKQGKLVVSFDGEFLKNVFANYKVAESSPIQSGELVYSTASRLHCGADNFVASYWRKVATADGNIVRNAALISRVGGESYFLTNIPEGKFTLLCTALTPDPLHYGIAYDSVTGQWYKTAGGVFQQFFYSDKEELESYLLHMDKSKGKPKAEDKKEDKKDKKDKSDEEKKLDDLLKEDTDEEDSLPLATAPDAESEPVGKDDAGTSEEDLMNLLKKEAKETK